MNSLDVYIIVEGSTELTFVRDVLAPHMAEKRIYLYSPIIGRPGHKGGDIRFVRARKEIGKYLKQRKNTVISTMFDYFRIDSKWPGKEEVSKKIRNGAALTASRKAEILETEMLGKIVKRFSDQNVERRFIPYVAMHEFEALLFSDADILAEKAEMEVSLIRKIVEAHGNPEEINDDPVKAPGKRLVALKKGYRKVAMLFVANSTPLVSTFTA